MTTSLRYYDNEHALFFAIFPAIFWLDRSSSGRRLILAVVLVCKKLVSRDRCDKTKPTKCG